MLAIYLSILSISPAERIVDTKKRTELYQQAQKVFKAEAPWVTIAHAKVFRAMSTAVSGYKIDPFGGDYFDKVDINP